MGRDVVLSAVSGELSRDIRYLVLPGLFGRVVFRDLMRSSMQATLVAILILLLFPHAARADDLSGIATITDGDTVIVAGRKLRLLATDAPETDQFCLDVTSAKWDCGIAARDALAKKTANEVWTCESTGRMTYDLELATCFVDGRISGSGWYKRDGRFRSLATATIMTKTNKRLELVKLVFGREHLSRHGIGDAETAIPQFWERLRYRSMRGGSYAGHHPNRRFPPAV